MHAKCNSHLIHILEMVEPARGTKASAHGPWGVYATAWELGWATNTPLQSCTALPTPYSTAQMRCQECRIVVCAQSSAARAAMGPWGNAPMPQGWQGTAWSPWGPHTHNHNHIQRSRLRIRRFELRFGCCTVVCTSSPAYRVAMGHWGQCPHTPGMAGHCLATLGEHTHTPQQPYYTVRIAVRGVVR